MTRTFLALSSVLGTSLMAATPALAGGCHPGIPCGQETVPPQVYQPEANVVTLPPETVYVTPDPIVVEREPETVYVDSEPVIVHREPEVIYVDAEPVIVERPAPTPVQETVITQVVHPVVQVPYPVYTPVPHAVPSPCGVTQVVLSRYGNLSRHGKTGHGNAGHGKAGHGKAKRCRR